MLLAACGSHALSSSPAGPPALTASGTADGVALRLDLDHATLRPGEVMWATLTVENTNDHAINWVTSGCDVPGRVTARVAALADYGRNWEYALASFKKLTAATATQGYVSFVDEQSWSTRAQAPRACLAAIGSHDLAAKGRLVSRFAWDGMLADGTAAANGDVSITGALEMNDPRSMTGHSVSAVLTLPLSGGSVTRVSAGQALDAALADDRLVSWLRARFIATGNSEPAAYRVTSSMRLDGDAWLITASQKTPPAGDIEIRVGAIDGAVRSVVAR